VLGIVFCDRYKLDSALYAMMVTVTTALSLITLPLWHQLLTRLPGLALMPLNLN